MQIISTLKATCMQYATEVRSVMAEVSDITSEEDGDVRLSRREHGDDKDRSRRREEKIRGLLQEQRGSDNNTFGMRLR